MNPTIGDRTIGMTTFSKTPAHLHGRRRARAAPTRPPISACEDDDGMPKYQVMRFQLIAPISAANTTTRPE